MTKSTSQTTSESSASMADGAVPDLAAVLEAQRAAFVAEGPPSLAVRLDRIDRMIAALLDNTDVFLESLRLDFGHRPAPASLATDILGPLPEILDTRRNLKRWMRRRRTQAGPLRLAGVRSWIEPHPLGVVGVIAPWNFPVTLAILPAVAALAAGNRVMIKMSELAPRTAEAFRAAIAERFPPDEVLVVTGGPEVGADFAAQRFDHLFFTGSSSIGRLVAQAAADNLVPVTLELGGKNPTVLGKDADLALAARRTVAARMTNSGQLCLSTDYVFVPAEHTRRFVDAATDALRHAFPTVADNDDYCSIISDGHYQRVTGLIEDARAKGADVIEVAPPEETLPSPATRRIPPTLLLNVTDDMAIMREEVFGPALAVLPYHDVDEVIDYLGARPLPLAAYWYGGNSADFRRFKARTRSGGLTRNDFAVHAAINGAPFGGVGTSGSGCYHGKYGFDTFSHLRTIAVAPKRFSPMSMVSPPFSPRATKGMRWFTNKQRKSVHRRLAKRAAS